MPAARTGGGGTDRASGLAEQAVFDTRPTLEELREPIRFDCCIFFYELFNHQCLPFSLPIIFLLEGFRGLNTREFLYPSKMMLLAHVYSVFTVLTAFFYISGNHSTLSIDILTVTGMVSFRNIAIAVKYAYRSTHMRRLNKVGRLTAALRRNEEVLSGLLPANPSEEIYDLVEGASRLQIDDIGRLVVLRAQDSPEGADWVQEMEELTALLRKEAALANPTTTLPVAGATLPTSGAAHKFAGGHTRRSKRPEASIGAQSEHRSAETAPPTTSADAKAAIAVLPSSTAPATATDSVRGGTWTQQASEVKPKSFSDGASKTEPGRLQTPKQQQRNHHPSEREYGAEIGFGASIPKKLPNFEQMLSRGGVHSMCITEPYRESLDLEFVIRPLAHLPEGLPGCTRPVSVSEAPKPTGRRRKHGGGGSGARAMPECASGPPVRPGVYALAPIAAIALHLRMLDSFEIHQMVKHMDKSWCLGLNNVWLFEVVFGLYISLLPAIGRFLSGKPITGELHLEAYIQFGLCFAGSAAMAAGFLAPFLLGLVLHSYRMLWAMKRLTGLIAETPEDHSTWIDTKRSYATQPARLSTPSETAPTSRRRHQRVGTTTTTTATADVESPSVVTDNAAERLAPTAANVHRFARPFVIDCRFDGSVNGFHELRRWVPYSHQRVVKRLEWVFVFQLVFVIAAATIIVASALSGTELTMEEHLPAAGTTLVSVLSLGLYLVQATGHNELLITHTHLIREQERGVYRDAESCTGTNSASLTYSTSSHAATKSWNMSRTSEEAHKVRQHTLTWPAPLSLMRATGDMYSAEAGDRHVGPKMRFAGIVIDRPLLRVLLSALTSSAIFIIQQVISTSA